jgi:SAM-dependent methyltransferase
MITANQVNCPACLNEAKVFSVLSSLEATSHFKDRASSIEEFKDLQEHIENLWQSDTCLRRRCDNCNLIFVDPFVAGDSFFYNLAQSSHVYPKNRWEYSVAIDNIGTLFDANFNLLEIGAGRGEFLVEVLSHGVPADHLLAIEFDKVGAKTIRELGIKCLEVDLRKAALPKSVGFSAIVMFQVFEHLDDLDSFLEILVSLLQDQGKVIVSVPNSMRIKFVEESIGFIDMPPNHLTTWSQESLEVLFNRNHLKMKYFEVEKANFLDFVYQLIYYSILKRRQNGTQLEKRILSLRMRKLRILVFAFFAFFHVFYRFSKILQFNLKLGGSQLAVFEKRSSFR